MEVYLYREDVKACKTIYNTWTTQNFSLNFTGIVFCNSNL